MNVAPEVNWQCGIMQNLRLLGDFSMWLFTGEFRSVSQPINTKFRRENSVVCSSCFICPSLLTHVNMAGWKWPHNITKRRHSFSDGARLKQTIHLAKHAIIHRNQTHQFRIWSKLKNASPEWPKPTETVKISEIQMAYINERVIGLCDLHTSQVQLPACILQTWRLLIDWLIYKIRPKVCFSSCWRPTDFTVAKFAIALIFDSLERVIAVLSKNAIFPTFHFLLFVCKLYAEGRYHF